MARGKEKGKQREIALERIRILFRQAKEKAVEGDIDSASRRVRQARNISVRCNVPIPKELKLSFCRKCLTFLTAGNSVRRLNPRIKRIEVKCGGCGNVMRRSYARKKREKAR